MSNIRYELLMKEIDAIIAKVEQLPESVRELVFHALVDALLDKDGADTANMQSSEFEAAPAQPPTSPNLGASDSSVESEFRRFFANYAGAKLNDMEFCALVAQFFTHTLPPPARVDAIGPEHLSKAVRLADRKPPSNAATTLNNAKNVKGYLEPKGKGIYALTAKGEEFVAGIVRKGSNQALIFDG